MNLAQVVNTKAVIRTERFVRIRGDCLNKDFMSVVRLQKQVIRILAKLKFIVAILKKLKQLTLSRACIIETIILLYF